MAADHMGDPILIVDDEEANVRLLSLVLRRAGFVASSSTLKSAEVSTLHREHHYALIVLDLQMPVMNGYDVMEELMRLDVTERPAILVMSADPTQSQRSLEAGATGFLGKPYSIIDVVGRIQGILSARPRPAAGIQHAPSAP
jgi:CheY-like chemotaxis protein